MAEFRVLRNLTPNRLILRGQAKAGGGELDPLEFAPLESKTIDKEIAEEYELEAYVRRNLLSVAMPPPAQNLSDTIQFFQAAFLAFGVLAIALTTQAEGDSKPPRGGGQPGQEEVQEGSAATDGGAARQQGRSGGGLFRGSSSWPVIIGGGVLLLLFLSIALNFRRHGTEAGLRQLQQMLSLTLIFLLGIGIPTAVIAIGGGLLSLLEKPADVQSFTFLARCIQLLFIVVASLLPAVLYYLFDRFQLSTLREKFYQDIFRLDGKVENLVDVASKYGAQLDEIYGAEASSSGRLARGTRAPILVCTMTIAIGWSLALMHPEIINVNATSADLIALFKPSPDPMIFGFLGAYLFTLNSILMRYVRRDLKPKAYTQATVRFTVVYILAWVLESLFSGLQAPLLAIAFLGGIVPDTILVYIRDAVRRRWTDAPTMEALRDRMPLTRLQGIDLYDRARLLGEGITNTEALAHHDFIDLMLETRIPVPRLVDWVDQSILDLHLFAAGEEEMKKMAGILGGYGIRTATGLIRAKQRLDGKFLRILGPDDKSKPQRLKVFISALEEDEWLSNIIHWRAAAGAETPTVDQSKVSAQPAGAQAPGPAPPVPAAPSPGAASPSPPPGSPATSAATAQPSGGSALPVPADGEASGQDESTPEPRP